MAQAQRYHVLRAYELRLLRCTLSPHPSDSPSAFLSSSDTNDNNNLHQHINHLLTCIEAGNYLQALSSPAAKLLLLGSSELPSLDSDLVGQFLQKETASVNTDYDEEDRACRVMVVMCIAVAAFFCFIQCNITGPLDELPGCPLPFIASEGSEFPEWVNWAQIHLLSHGSHLLGKFSNLQHIVFAKMLVMRTKDLLFEGSVSSLYGIKTISWWLARLLLIEQRILDELSSSLFDLLKVSMTETLHHFGSLEQVTSYWVANLHNEEACAIVSLVHLEAGIMEHTYGRVDLCRQHFETAEAAAGLRLSITGVLGYRTVYQTEPKAQRVLVAERSSSDSGGNSTSISYGIQMHDSTSVEDNVNLHKQETSDSDILKTPVLLEDGNNSGIGGQGSQNGGPNGVFPLKAIQQAVILARCLLIEISTRHDELQRWDMAPFIEAIDSQPSSLFILCCFCDLLRIRWESTRSRTKERALGMMEKLVEGVLKPLPGVAQRIPFCYVANIPTIPALKKEYGELLVSCGLIGEAIKIFEDLELWDNLIYCYCLLEKKAAAVQLINIRLSEMPNDPRLWCSLGDITNNDSCYEKALEVSNDKSARAKRSLARSAYNRGDYETSKILWESAMALNSLYPDGWFALGAAALKARDVDKALAGFTQAVKLDPENGEAWNNIACLHMIRKRSDEAFIAFKEALKFKRDSWQMWEQYSHVAMDVGNIHQALEAVQMVLHMTRGKEINADLLERIMLEMEEQASSRDSMCPSVTNDHSPTIQNCPDDSSNASVNNSKFNVGRSRESEQLMELLGKILQQVVRIGSGSEMWGLYARWHKLKGDLTMCSEALLKQVRSYQGFDLWKDKDRFKKLAHASLELCKVYMEISSTTGSHRELSTAEMHLKSIVRQAGSFSETEEFRDLQACLDEVKLKLQSDTTPT